MDEELFLKNGYEIDYVSDKLPFGIYKKAIEHLKQTIAPDPEYFDKEIINMIEEGDEYGEFWCEFEDNIKYEYHIELHRLSSMEIEAVISIWDQKIEDEFKGDDDTPILFALVRKIKFIPQFS